MPSEDMKQIPIGHWERKSKNDRNLGGQMLTNLIDGLNSFGPAILGTAGDRDEIQRLITDAVKQYKDSTWKLHMNMYTPSSTSNIDFRMYCAVQKVV